jgi:hypothetical protein
MLDAASIRAADDNQIATRIVDPLLVATQDRKAWDALRLAERAVAVVWLFHAVACRSGLASYVAEEPAWVQDATATAARAVGLAEVAAGWEAATRGMDLASWRDEIPADITWGDRGALEALQHELVAGRYWNMTSWLAGWIREHADAFVRGTA